MTAKETTPVKAGVVSVPYGHVIGNEKWRGSQIAQGLQDLAFCIFLKQIWWQEMASKDVLFGLEISLHGIVIVEKTQISDQYFPTVQKFIVLELGMTLLPVANQGEASQLIIQLVHEQSKDHTSNPFLHKKCPQLVEASILRTVQQIPGVGKTKALLLLQQFPVIKEPAFPVFPQTTLREAPCGQKTGLLLLESAEMQIKSQFLISFRLRSTLS
ncbi:Fanconi anemia core complex-associated protein 24 isoform X4 [Dermochelys coriacea]|uniref:Fanconi anemia core complex-associated protein 24 isoform X4 n=1 Tax=Dermochelys coriacea TaxID=27794 RepID=UPI001CA8C6DF|nr:Fanconi anemia core complex-associated protein 24 isoform X4 [Dermochelys coriacea]